MIAVKRQSLSVINKAIFLDVFVVVVLCNRAGHDIFALSFLLSSIYLFFPHLISAVADWMSTHMVWR